MLHCATMSNCKRLSEMLTRMGLSEYGAAYMFGTNVATVRSILAGQTTPEYTVRQRIEVLSRNWNGGLIWANEWPSSIPDPESSRVAVASKETVRPGKKRARR
jgi:hypothetical protein